MSTSRLALQRQSCFACMNPTWVVNMRTVWECWTLHEVSWFRRWVFGCSGFCCDGACYSTSSSSGEEVHPRKKIWIFWSLAAPTWIDSIIFMFSPKLLSHSSNNMLKPSCSDGSGASNLEGLISHDFDPAYTWFSDRLEWKKWQPLDCKAFRLLCRLPMELKQQISNLTNCVGFQRWIYKDLRSVSPMHYTVSFRNNPSFSYDL